MGQGYSAQRGKGYIKDLLWECLQLLKEDGIKAIILIAPFVDNRILLEYVKEQYFGPFGIDNRKSLNKNYSRTFTH